jgi:peptidoglycan/xylan/chitin deacetylase (PgdA/CDA1 family)
VSLKKFIALFVGSAFYYSGAFNAFRSWNNRSGRRLTILTYHRVTHRPVDEIEESLPYLFVNAYTFEKQLIFLKEHYNIIGLRDLENCRDNKSLPRNSLLITFDDGYEDTFATAYPILLKHNIPFGVFLSVEWLGKREVPWWDEMYFRLKSIESAELDGSIQRLNGLARWIFKMFKRNSSNLFAKLNNWEKERIERVLDSMSEFNDRHGVLQSHNRPLRWEMAKEMLGLGEFGSHGYSHESLVTLDVEEVRTEALRSKKELEDRLGREVITFCYPSGKHSEMVKRVIGESGYAWALTQDKGINDLKDRYALKRINIGEGSGNVRWGRFSAALFALRVAGL